MIIAIITPIAATVSPVCVCVRSRTTESRKITQLKINPDLSVIASEGLGIVEVSTPPSFCFNSLRKAR